MINWLDDYSVVSNLYEFWIVAKANTMHLESEFIRLQVAFDAPRLAAEIKQIDTNLWGNSESMATDVTHHELNFLQNSDEVQQRCVYLSSLLASLVSIAGKVSLIRVSSGTTFEGSINPAGLWQNKLQLVLCICLDADAKFITASTSQYSAKSGEVWVADSLQKLGMENPGNTESLYLLCESPGTAELWRSIRYSLSEQNEPQMKLIKVDEGSDNNPLKIIVDNQPAFMSPDAITVMMQRFMAGLAYLRNESETKYKSLNEDVEEFILDWRCQSLLANNIQQSMTAYQGLCTRVLSSVLPKLESLSWCNGRTGGRGRKAQTERKELGLASKFFEACITATINLQAVDKAMERDKELKANNINSIALNRFIDSALFESPIFIVAAPRSGSTMLFETLEQHRELWTLGDESHQLFESIPALHPASHGFESNALDAEDLNDEIGRSLLAGILRKLRNANGKKFSEMPDDAIGSGIRFLEKTPKNALRIPFLQALFPSAKFVYLYRDPEPNIGSIIDAWNSGKFVTYPRLPNWPGKPWSLLLSNGWQKFKHRPLAEIAAWQWASTNKKIINDLQKLPADKWIAINYSDVLQEKEAKLRELCAFSSIAFGPKMQALCKQDLPDSKYTLSKPNAEKWKRHQAEIDAAFEQIPEVSEVNKRLKEI